MKIGVGLINDNSQDWPRFNAIDADRNQPITPPVVSDADITWKHLQLGKLAEPLGYDSIWTLEHHFSPYTMITNPMQWLAYFAGCTEKIGFGTFIYVLNWWHPLRAVEQLITLDHMTQGRDLRIGLGRGTARREYEGLGISQLQTRPQFKESLEILRLAMKEEWFEYNGEIYQIPRTTLRPAPRDREFFKDRLYMAWLSPSSLPIFAEQDLQPLILPNQSWEAAHGDLANANKLRVEKGLKPGRPIVVIFFYCAETDEKAAEVFEHTVFQSNSTNNHYELLGDHWKDLPGYEDHAQRVAALAAQEGGETDPAKARAALAQTSLANQDAVGYMHGSPDTIIKKLEAANKFLGPEEMVLIFSFGGMPREVSEASMRLFAKEVLPVVQSWAQMPAPMEDAPLGPVDAVRIGL